MIEYINREKLLKKAKEINSIFSTPLIIREIENAPAEDVAAIVRGKWIDLGTNFKSGVHWYRCSNCGSYESGVHVKPYCSYCGCKMDNGGKENE